MFEDDELICNLSDCVEVFPDCVKICLPEVPIIILTDDQLDHMFFYPDSVSSLCVDGGVFWCDLVSFVYRTRALRRDLYEFLGFVDY